MAPSHRHDEEEWKSYCDPTITASGTIKTTDGMLMKGTAQLLQTIYNIQTVEHPQLESTKKFWCSRLRDRCLSATVLEPTSKKLPAPNATCGNSTKVNPSFLKMCKIHKELRQETPLFLPSSWRHNSGNKLTNKRANKVETAHFGLQQFTDGYKLKPHRRAINKSYDAKTWIFTAYT